MYMYIHMYTCVCVCVCVCVRARAYIYCGQAGGNPQHSQPPFAQLSHMPTPTTMHWRERTGALALTGRRTDLKVSLVRTEEKLDVVHHGYPASGFAEQVVVGARNHGDVGLLLEDGKELGHGLASGHGRPSVVVEGPGGQVVLRSCRVCVCVHACACMCMHAVCAHALLGTRRVCLCCACVYACVCACVHARYRRARSTKCTNRRCTASGTVRPRCARGRMGAGRPGRYPSPFPSSRRPARRRPPKAPARRRPPPRASAHILKHGPQRSHWPAHPHRVLAAPPCAAPHNRTTKPTRLPCGRSALLSHHTTPSSAPRSAFCLGELTNKPHERTDVNTQA